MLNIKKVNLNGKLTTAWMQTNHDKFGTYLLCETSESQNESKFLNIFNLEPISTIRYEFSLDCSLKLGVHQNCSDVGRRSADENQDVLVKYKIAFTEGTFEQTGEIVTAKSSSFLKSGTINNVISKSFLLFLFQLF